MEHEERSRKLAEYVERWDNGVLEVMVYAGTMKVDERDFTRPSKIPRYQRILVLPLPPDFDWTKMSNIDTSKPHLPNAIMITEDEIRYRRDLTQRERLKISNETDKKSIPMLRKQQISLSRVLARQDGKVPSEAIYDENRKGWYCITDTRQQSKIQVVSTQKKEISDDSFITPSDVVESTIKVETGRQEINSTTQEIRRTQDRSKEQEQQL